MIDRLRQLFSKPKLNAEDMDFFTKLATSDIWILAVGLRGTPSVPNIANEEAFETLAAHRIDVSEIGDDDSVFPFNYERDGRQFLPFFTSEERARHFAHDSGFLTDLAVFQPCSILAGFVASPENDLFDLILDPRTSAERKISKEVRLLIRSLSTA